MERLVRRTRNLAVGHDQTIRQERDGEGHCTPSCALIEDASVGGAVRDPCVRIIPGHRIQHLKWNSYLLKKSTLYEYSADAAKLFTNQ